MQKENDTEKIPPRLFLFSPRHYVMRSGTVYIPFISRVFDCV